jgi:hypothetical protein
MVVRLPSAFAASISSCDGPAAAEADAEAEALALSDGAAALSEGAAEGADVAAPPPDEHAANTMADVASRPAQRVRSRFMVNRASSKVRS